MEMTREELKEKFYELLGAYEENKIGDVFSILNEWDSDIVSEWIEDMENGTSD